jgi:hypothetical protein
MCKYQWEYGPINYFVNMHGAMPNIMLGKSNEKNKNNHEITNKSHKGLEVLMKR